MLSLFAANKATPGFVSLLHHQSFFFSFFASFCRAQDETGLWLNRPKPTDYMSWLSTARGQRMVNHVQTLSVHDTGLHIWGKSTKTLKLQLFFRGKSVKQYVETYVVQQWYQSRMQVWKRRLMGRWTSDVRVWSCWETGVPLKGQPILQAAGEAPGWSPSGISPGKAAKDPASGSTPAPATEPDGKINTLWLCLVVLNTVLCGILGYDSCWSNPNIIMFSSLLF